MRTQLKDVSKTRFTDPHMGNLGIAIPQLQQIAELDVMDYFSDPVLTAVVPHDTLLSLESYLVYLTETSPLEEMINCNQHAGKMTFLQIYQVSHQSRIAHLKSLCIRYPMEKLGRPGAKKPIFGRLDA